MKYYQVSNKKTKIKQKTTLLKEQNLSFENKELFKSKLKQLRSSVCKQQNVPHILYFMIVQ